MNIGNKIKELRKSNNLTQLQLSKELSVGQSTISEWEKGEYEPTASALRQIALFFDVSADYLLEINEIDGRKIENKTYNITFK